jgi:hypothetical protein
MLVRGITNDINHLTTDLPAGLNAFPTVLQIRVETRANRALLWAMENGAGAERSHTGLRIFASPFLLMPVLYNSKEA